MLDSIMKLIIGDMADKRAYRQMMKRVAALPKDYQFAFRKIQHYMFRVGPPDGDLSIFTDLTMFSDLIDFFEAGAAEGRPVLDVIGHDVSQFSDDFMRMSATDAKSLRAKLNQEIMEKFNKEGQ